MSKATASDMSVEEILKSIKGIITDRMSDVENHNEDVLELTKIITDTDKEQESVTDEIKEEPLISSKSATEAKNTFKKFAKVAENCSNTKKNFIEEWIVEIMRPGLSQWLDSNLPALVKEVVEKEIQKLMPNNIE